MARDIQLRRGRGAYTMMELLIVITIMIMLAAITLPVAKQVLNDSHLREASRQLSAYFIMAKARAVHTGRPCGIHFVCQPPLGNATGIRAVTQLYLAEVPPPYCGDIIGAQAYANSGGAGPWQLTFDANAASLQNLISVGERFEIRFNYKGPWFVGKCTSTSPSFAASVYGPGGLDGAYGRAGIDDDGNMTVDDASEYRWPGSDDLPVLPPTLASFYQIRRAPRRIGNPLELPAGSCIDMEYSGMGQSGADFGYLANGGNQLQVLGILFSPQGNVEALYTTVFNGTATSTIGPIDPTGTLHFLIGKIEKMNLPNGATDDTNRNPSNVHLFDRTESNLADPTSLWVSVGRSGGGVTTAENDPPPTNLPSATTTAVTIFPNEPLPAQGGRQQTLNPSTQFASALSIFLGYSRTIATNREQMRGR
jgi:type II secretory pathway pseudopilin PulG